MKKITIIAAITAVAAAFSACGSVDDGSAHDTTIPSAESVQQQDGSSSEETAESSADDNADSKASAEDTSSADEDDTSSDTDEESAPDDNNAPAEIPQLSGSYIESIDGTETNYIIIGEPYGYVFPIGTVSGTPVEVSFSDEKVLIDRGSGSEALDYSWSDGVLSFEENEHQYEWRSVEYIPVVGDYNMVDGEGTILSRWTFGSDGSGVRSDDVGEVGFTFSQTADTFTISLDGGSSYESGYTYDIYRLVMTVDGETVTFAAANS